MRNNVTNLSSLLGTPSRGGVAAASGEETPQEYEAFAHGRVGNRPQLMVVFRKASGAVHAFSYASLLELHAVDPERGCVVDFAGVKVAIVGEKLGRLFRYLCDHKAAEIVEADRAMVFQGASDSPVVTSIVVSVATR